MASKEAEPYDACPYCLTEIAHEETQIIEETQKPAIEGIYVKESDVQFHKDDHSRVLSKEGCTHHFGYLSKRATKEKIPDECIVCEKIVQCMLQNVTS